MKKRYFYAHGGSGNHGCEAIVRSTKALLGGETELLSADPAQDIQYAVDQIVQVSPVPKCKLSFWEKVLCSLDYKLLKTGTYDNRIRAKHECSTIAPGSVAFSIGGDNYCYGEGYAQYLHGCNRALHQKGVKTVLWGCSIEPKEIDEERKKDFALYDLIVARETISYAALKACNPNTVLSCDPAFFLEKEELPLPKEFAPGKTVGINLSPLIQSKESAPGITMENYRRLMSHILENTDYHIALIPHVVVNGGEDLLPLTALYEQFSHTGRVCLIADDNCCRLKGYIARCSMFIGARTHATIAAYSTMVPTLVVGYSTKSVGIAKDLFGTPENYVLPVQQLKEPDDLIKAFRWLMQHQDDIAAHLQATIPPYKEQMKHAVAAVNQL